MSEFSRSLTSPLDEAIIDKTNAERDFFLANARVAKALARQEEVALRVRERAESEVMSRDEYHNIFLFDQDVDDQSVKDCMQTLTNWARKDPDCEIEIQLNTSGGSIFAGFTLIDFIRELRSRGHQITIVVYGHAASMGAVILQAADHRVMGENAFLLLHEGSMFAGGDAGQIEDEVKLFKKLQGRILGLLTERATIDQKKIQSSWKRTDWWLESSEALQLGLVDEVR